MVDLYSYIPDAVANTLAINEMVKIDSSPMTRHGGTAQKLCRHPGITTRGCEKYILMRHELVSWARLAGIPVGPGRGAAPSSIFNYILGITDCRFSRITNVQLTSMKDILKAFKENYPREYEDARQTDR